MNRSQIKTLLSERNPAFWDELVLLTQSAIAFDDLFFLASLRKKAVALGLTRQRRTVGRLRLAIIGGCNLYPLHDLLVHLLDSAGFECDLFLGEYDNYVAEIKEGNSALYAFAPQVVFLLPSSRRCRYSGSLGDAREIVQPVAEEVSRELLNLCATAHGRTSAEIILANFLLPARHDPGSFRNRTLASDWSFRKWVNLALGLNAPPYVRICDLEFLGCRHGTLPAEDARAWFESKQPCSAGLLVDLCREATHLIAGLKAAPKKVLVLDLDNTLWGGVVADDGLGGIEIGDTSSRGEAFKAFQRQVLALKQRGVLLAVCSKNDRELALEPFEKHPEMVLKLSDFVAFTANWEPKSDNLRQMASDLNLSLDSFVFVDDNPAEIEILRQFVPEVTTILLGPDPAGYAAQLQDCRLFESHNVTDEDSQRTTQYHAESKRRELLKSTTDMESYLASLEMIGSVRDFTDVDVPRLAQLIARSNQFNLTTLRRSESDLRALIDHPQWICFSMRLGDRFGDHGLISVVIAKLENETAHIDTWLMSCRVLKRQVEDAMLNELVQRVRAKGVRRLLGVYLPTAKNGMVRDFYPQMGFTACCITHERAEFVLALDSFETRPTKIIID